MKYKKSIFIFRRDLRLEDNTGLIKALNESDEVIPIFIFNLEQLENNEYKGDNLIEFMLNSLSEVNLELQKLGSKLYFFYGNNLEVLTELRKEINFDAIYVNEDYIPFSIKRDNELNKFCQENNISFDSSFDLLLNHPKTVVKADGNPYTIFTPYYKAAIKLPVNPIVKNTLNNYFNGKIDLSKEMKIIFAKILDKKNENLLVKGGRSEALRLLDELSSLDYLNRDLPYVKGTSYLSAHNKFGTVSVREIYSYVNITMKDCEMFIRQLYWRDFFTQIAYHFPKVFGNAFLDKYNSIKWTSDFNRFQKWCNGETGFPIIDAAMRELNTTGYMNNRCRMIVASFLTKDLHIDWKLGEKYFAKKLVDYDPSVNNGSWQWAASTGCDAQPYFRVFNPWLQQKKFDPDCVYIKKWLPELSKLSSNAIHNLEIQRPIFELNYPKPMVNHGEEKAIAIGLYTTTN